MSQEGSGDALRERLYSSYVSADQARPPSDLAELASRAPYLQRVVRRHFPDDRGARILDIGCGHGSLIHVARETGYRELRGVDGSQEQVDAAKHLGIEGVECGDLMETLRAQPAASLDVVCAFDVLEHFRKDELLALVDAVFHALRPGGRWIVHVPNGESPFFGAIRHGDLTHEGAFTRQSIHQLLVASGFEAVDCFEDEPVAHGAKSSARLIVWKLVRSLLRLAAAAETGETGGQIFTRNLLAVARKPAARD